MTKAEIVNSIAQRTGIAKPEVAATVEAFMDEIRTSLAVNKENVYLRGFGSFITKKRAAKVARNISKSTSVYVPEHRIPAFKPAAEFAAEVRK